jgi:hypothetical protein
VLVVYCVLDNSLALACNQHPQAAFTPEAVTTGGSRQTRERMTCASLSSRRFQPAVLTPLPPCPSNCLLCLCVTQTETPCSPETFSHDPCNTFREGGGDQLGCHCLHLIQPSKAGVGDGEDSVDKPAAQHLHITCRCICSTSSTLSFLHCKSILVPKYCIIKG